MALEAEVVVIGSGAGAGPVARVLAEAGIEVLVLEKGPWLTEADFFKDELACCRRDTYTPPLSDEQHVIETPRDGGGFEATPTSASGWSWWNGNCVGGASNFMSGFFLRLKPEDFRLRSTFGEIPGANVADWPIDYAELEPYYDRVEREVGVSGRVVAHRFAEPRSSADFPFPPTAEHPVARWIDDAAGSLGLTPLPMPRAILPAAALGRRGCEYSGYCGSYGCRSGAKGSARAALLDPAVATGHCTVRPWSMVTRLESDARGRVVAAHVVDRDGTRHRAVGRVFVVACQAVETCRLLLASTGPRFPRGLANNHGQVGRNLVFSAGGSGSGLIANADLDQAARRALAVMGPFVNRTLQDFYHIDDPALAPAPVKGGSIDLMLEHPNPIPRAMSTKWDGDGRLNWGRALKQAVKRRFTEGRRVRFETFCDWLPSDECFVTLDPDLRDRFGMPVARVRVGHHPHDDAVGRYLARQAERVLAALGAKDIAWSVTGLPPQNLQAGGCRFGDDPATSVLDRHCRAHEVENLYVTDGSFMPTGGSVPFTFTIYANAYRVAEHLKSLLGRA